MKIIMRILVFFVVITLFSLFIIYITDQVEKIMVLQQEKSSIRTFFSVLGITGSISVFSLWILTFYHWGTSNFKKRVNKIIWFWVILIGGFVYVIGPIVYYFSVVEMCKGLKIDEKVEN